MADAGIDIRDADVLIGTSSGGRVALQLASNKPLEEIFEQQLTVASRVARPGVGVDWSKIQREVAHAKELGGERTEILKCIGALALANGGPDRRALVASQLPMQNWPERRVLLTALNAETGLRRAFDRESGIDLVDAVMATTAFFGFPPVWFEGAPYIDGGFHSSDNADLAAGYAKVLVLALKPPPSAMKLVTLEEGVADLRATGAEVVVIQPDEEAAEAIASGGTPMNPAICEPATRAGRAQGHRVVQARGTTGWW